MATASTYNSTVCKHQIDNNIILKYYFTLFNYFFFCIYLALYVAECNEVYTSNLGTNRHNQDLIIKPILTSAASHEKLTGFKRIR